MPARLLWLTVIVASITWSGPARAGVPSPPQSSVDPCFVVCPNGDIAFHVVVRDVASLPIANAVVIIDLCSCVGPTFNICPGIACQVAALTDLNGAAVFHINAGGTCDSPVNVYADGVLLAARRVASPDQNGDLIVDAADASILGGKIGTTDPSGDLDCDGSVTPNDMSVRALHAQHACGIVPTNAQSWGKVKAIYR
jgi:hypothetical protein